MLPLHHAGTTNLVPHQRFELRLPRPERSVLPLNERGTTKLGCAGRGRTDIALINSQILYQLRYRTTKTPAFKGWGSESGYHNPQLHNDTLRRITGRLESDCAMECHNDFHYLPCAYIVSSMFAELFILRSQTALPNQFRLTG